MSKTFHRKPALPRAPLPRQKGGFHNDGKRPVVVETDEDYIDPALDPLPNEFVPEPTDPNYWEYFEDASWPYDDEP